MRTLASALTTFLVFLFSLSNPLEAHIPVHGAGTASQIVFRRDGVRITFDLSYRGYWAQAEMLAVDTNRDSEVDTDEADRYLRRRWEKKIAPALSSRIDGQPVQLELLRSYHEDLVGAVYPTPFSLFYELQTRPAGRFTLGEVHTFEFEDSTIKGEVPGTPRFLIPFAGHGGESGQVRFVPEFVEPANELLDPQSESYVLDGEKLVVRFVFSERVDEAPRASENDQAAGESGSAPNAARDAAEETPVSTSKTQREVISAPGEEPGDDGEMRMVYAFNHYPDLSWWTKVGFLVLAVLYGMGHAFTPGHGKAMVAAYLIGTKGRIRDAVALGLTVTLSHTVAVFVIGVIVFYLAFQAESSGGAVRNKALVLTSLASGLFFVGMGLMLFYRRSKGLAAGYQHDHSHGHAHTHVHRHDHGHSHTHSREGNGDGHDHGHARTHRADTSGTTEVPADAGRRATLADTHSHECHEHREQGSEKEEHSAQFPEESPRLRELLALGLAAGILPCPAGLVVVGLGLHQSFDDISKLLYGIGLLLCFSAGLAAVLVAIGVFLITGKQLAARRIRDGVFFEELSFLKKIFAAQFLKALDRAGRSLLRAIPAFSCLFVAALGSFFVVKTLIVGRVEIADLVRTVAGWVGL